MNNYVFSYRAQIVLLYIMYVERVHIEKRKYRISQKIEYIYNNMFP